MKQHKIAYYISSHGFGHLTRSLALIEYILKNTNYSFYICSGKKQIDFAKIYLEEFSNRVIYSEECIDVGILNKKDSLEVDVETTNKAVFTMLELYDSKSTYEAKKVKEFNVELIISDVSAFACLVSKKTGINLLQIGNFTWTDQYISIGANKEIIEKFKKLYSICKNFIAYDFSLDFSGAREECVFRSSYITSRPICNQRIFDIRHKYSKLYKEKTGEKRCNFLYLSVGKSAELPTIKISNFKGVVFHTQGIKFNEDKYPYILFVGLPNEIKDSQSFVAASDLVIAKAGWSTAAESVVSHSKALLIERPDVDDDTNTINTLKSKKLVSSLSIDEVINLDFKSLQKRANIDIDINELNSITNDTKKLCDKILSYL